MRGKSLRVFVGVVVFGLLLGVSSTAYADALSITSFSVSNLQFTPATGSAQFTVTGASARAQAMNSFGQTQDIVSNTFPLAQAAVAVNFASASATANATTNSVSGANSASIGGCSCTASSFSIATLTGTLVITGGQGSVNVNISGLSTLLRQVQTDGSGLLAESETIFDIFVNGVSVFSVDALNPIGPNGSALVEVTNAISRTISLEFGVVNTIDVRLSTRSLAVNEVPEPATVVLLISGLGLMAGIKKRRK